MGPFMLQVTLVEPPLGSSVKSAMLRPSNGSMKSSLIVTLEGDDDSAIPMLPHIGEGGAGDRVMSALSRVLGTASTRTRDLGGTASTSAFADAVCRTLES